MIALVFAAFRIGQQMQNFAIERSDQEVNSSVARRAFKARYFSAVNSSLPTFQLKKAHFDAGLPRPGCAFVGTNLQVVRAFAFRISYPCSP
jgi:hypothetical protein